MSSAADVLCKYPMLVEVPSVPPMCIKSKILCCAKQDWPDTADLHRPLQDIFNVVCRVCNGYAIWKCVMSKRQMRPWHDERIVG